MVETAMVLPWLFLIIFGITQLTLYLYTRNVVHYAAFMAARSAEVYGSRTLKDIEYPYVGSGKETNPDKMIVEAIAEKIIFESLPWENSKIRELTKDDERKWFERVYFNPRGESASVKVEEPEVSGTEATIRMTYCMPVLFGITDLFIGDDHKALCKGVQKPMGGSYNAIPVEEKVTLQIR